VMKKMDLGKKGRKHAHALLFMDLQRAFDDVDRGELLGILRRRLGNEEEFKLISRLLIPQTVVLENGMKFRQERGVP